MVKRDFHGQGIGRELFNYRLSRITKEYRDLPLQIDTSQHTKRFDEKCGFVTYKIEKDGYDLGLDKVYMRLSLNQLTTRQSKQTLLYMTGVYICT